MSGLLTGAFGVLVLPAGTVGLLPCVVAVVTRDMFNGALTDLGLGADPWNANRYMFGGGNPISRIELNGHCSFDPETESACGRPVTRTLGSGSTPQPVKPQVPNNVGQELNKSMGLQPGASQQQQLIKLSQLGVPPAVAGLKLAAEEADRAGVDEVIELYGDLSGVNDAEDCAQEQAVRACGMTGMALLPFGKLAKLAKVLAALKYADEAGKTTIGEVKNVKHLDNRSQLQDDVAYAQANGLEFNLYVRESTTFSGPLQNLIDTGVITRVPSLGP